eukprot:scaffold326833_cov36-Prasinocladus_malaysianus.AAC.1
MCVQDVVAAAQQVPAQAPANHPQLVLVNLNSTCHGKEGLSTKPVAPIKISYYAASICFMDRSFCRSPQAVPEPAHRYLLKSIQVHVRHKSRAKGSTRLGARCDFMEILSAKTLQFTMVVK